MKLITAHRILIVAAIAFFGFFAVLQLLRAPGMAAIIEAVVSAVVAVGLVLYYRTLSRWGK